MADDLNKRRPQDSSRVNVHEKWELDYWSKELGVTPDKLKEIVKSVGPMADDVRKETSGSRG